MNMYAFLFVLNFFAVYGMNVSFYTEQEHGALQLCSQEYNTHLDLPHFVANAAIPDETDHNMKCLFYCVPQKIGVNFKDNPKKQESLESYSHGKTDDTGVINSVQIRDMIKTKYPSLSHTAVKILIKKCGKERAMDKCDKWYEVSKCTWKLYLEYKAKVEGKKEKRTTTPRITTTRRHHHHPEPKEKKNNHQDAAAVEEIMPRIMN